jgi:hypothetical protein
VARGGHCTAVRRPRGEEQPRHTPASRPLRPSRRPRRRPHPGPPPSSPSHRTVLRAHPPVTVGARIPAFITLREGRHTYNVNSSKGA